MNVYGVLAEYLKRGQKVVQWHARFVDEDGATVMYNVRHDDRDRAYLVIMKPENTGHLHVCSVQCECIETILRATEFEARPI